MNRRTSHDLKLIVRWICLVGRVIKKILCNDSTSWTHIWFNWHNPARCTLGFTCRQSVGYSLKLRVFFVNVRRPRLNHMQVLFLRTFPLGRLGFVSFSRITQLRHLSKSFLSLSISSNCEIMTVAKKPFERLPSNVVPKNYGLTLQPNLTEFTFTGKEVIDLEVRGILKLTQDEKK